MTRVDKKTAAARRDWTTIRRDDLHQLIQAALHAPLTHRPDPTVLRRAEHAAGPTQPRSTP